MKKAGGEDNKKEIFRTLWNRDIKLYAAIFGTYGIYHERLDLSTVKQGLIFLQNQDNDNKKTQMKINPSANQSKLEAWIGVEPIYAILQTAA